MFRTSPPRGRARRRALLAAVLCTVAVATPASAARDVGLHAPGLVTQPGEIDVLVTGGVGPLSVEITDAAGGVSGWRFRPSTVLADRPLTLDLQTPESGTAPVNGPATIALIAGGVPLTQITTVLDRSPAQPDLTTVVRGQRVGLLWAALPFAGPVTYRLERIAAGGSWTILSEGVAADGFTDRGLEPGRYRYRLTTAIPGADGAPRWSQPSAAQVRILAPPAPPPVPTSPEPAPTVAAPAPGRPRPVAATGDVRRTFSPQPRQRDPLQTVTTAIQPAVDGPAPPASSGAPAVATPEIAAPAIPAPTAAPRFEPFPVTMPPAGALAVQAGRTWPAEPLLLLGALALLTAAAGGAHRWRHRRPIPAVVTPVPDGLP